MDCVVAYWYLQPSRLSEEEGSQEVSSVHISYLCGLALCKTALKQAMVSTYPTCCPMNSNSKVQYYSRKKREKVN